MRARLTVKDDFMYPDCKIQFCKTEDSKNYGEEDRIYL